MQISFWKKLERERHDSPTPASMRTSYIEAGRIIAESLAGDDNILAVWLSGPFDDARVQPSSDLHISVLVECADHIVYRHQIPSFSIVKRRLEIAFLPLPYLKGIVERGYDSWDDVFALHKLHEPEILYNRDGTLSSLLDKLSMVTPLQMFVGRELNHMLHIYRQIEDLSQSKQHRDVFFLSRTFVLACMKILLVVGCTKTFSKTSHVYSSISQITASPSLPSLERINHLGIIDQAQAEQILTATHSLLRSLFERMITCDEDSN